MSNNLVHWRWKHCHFSYVSALKSLTLLKSMLSSQGRLRKRWSTEPSGFRKMLSKGPVSLASVVRLLSKWSSFFLQNSVSVLMALVWGFAPVEWEKRDAQASISVSCQLCAIVFLFSAGLQCIVLQSCSAIWWILCRLDCPCGYIPFPLGCRQDTSAITGTFRLCCSFSFQLDVGQRLPRTLFHHVLSYWFFHVNSLY